MAPSGLLRSTSQRRPRYDGSQRQLARLSPANDGPDGDLEPAEVLEHPEQAFAAYRADGVPHVICEEKHMAARAIVIVCRDSSVAKVRFGIDSDEGGVIYSRTGRPSLSSAAGSAESLGRVRVACDGIGLWDALSTEWVLLDCERMPWSAKAIELIRRQYAAVGAAAPDGLGASIAALEQAQSRGLDVAELLDSQRRRTEHVGKYVDAYRRYILPVQSVADLRLAPFHVLAVETGAFIDRGHDWQLGACPSSEVRRHFRSDSGFRMAWLRRFAWSRSRNSVGTRLCQVCLTVWAVCA
ncbi:MAG: hypothetical protein ACRDL5_07315 [Solirubrobacteraceae bacterium]